LASYARVILYEAILLIETALCSIISSTFFARKLTS
jgi:hypothetical protein